LVLAVGYLRGQLSQGGRDNAHVSTVNRDGRGERTSVGLSLGDTSALLHVGVQRYGDRGENADDRHDDQKPDEREGPPTTTGGALPVPKLSHVPLRQSWLRTLRRLEHELCRAGQAINANKTG